jgi:hypothetical protein
MMLSPQSVCREIVPKLAILAIQFRAEPSHWAYQYLQLQALVSGLNLIIGSLMQGMKDSISADVV